jgi:hypothetical protein
VKLSTVHYYDFTGETETERDANERKFILFRPISTIFTGLNIWLVVGFHFVFSTHNNVLNVAAQKQNTNVKYFFMERFQFVHLILFLQTGEDIVLDLRPECQEQC